MKDLKHTPAPWITTEFGDIEAKDTHICTINQSMLGNKYPELTTHLEATANAKLIASAPELLEALTELADEVQKQCSIGSDPRFLTMLEKWQKSQQAIKKATE